MEQVFSYIISLGASVMMPIIFTVIGLCIGMKFGKALKSGLFVGVGFVGLGVVTALLTTNFNDSTCSTWDGLPLQPWLTTLPSVRSLSQSVSASTS